MAGRSYYNIRSFYTKSSARLMAVNQFRFGSIELEGDEEPTTIEDLKRLTVVRTRALPKHAAHSPK